MRGEFHRISNSTSQRNYNETAQHRNRLALVAQGLLPHHFIQSIHDCRSTMLRTLRFIWNHPLASQNRAAAYGRYFSWQIGSRILKQPMVVPFVGNSKLVIERSMTGATGNYYCGLHEFQDMAFLLHFLRPSDSFADIGANIGSYTILASAVVGAHSIAFEPVPITFERLERNISVNNISKLVTAHKAAIGASAGHISFSTDRDTVNQVVSASYSGATQMVPVVPIDAIAVSNPCIFWKVDVEGYEAEVLRGGTESLRSDSLQAILLEGNSADVIDAMRTAGFQRASYDPFHRAVSGGKNEAGGVRTTLNSLWVRDLTFVAQRCVNGPSFSVNGHMV